MEDGAVVALSAGPLFVAVGANNRVVPAAPVEAEFGREEDDAMAIAGAGGKGTPGAKVAVQLSGSAGT